MRNFIQEINEDLGCFPNLIEVLSWLEIKAEEFDWHFSDIDGGWKGIEDPSFIGGEDLAKRLNEYNYQLGWAVISAYPLGTLPFTNQNPFADGNSEFWSGIPKKQLHDSLFEIVCWDSSATLFINLPKALATSLIKNAPGLKDLNEENKRRKC